MKTTSLNSLLVSALVLAPLMAIALYLPGLGKRLFSAAGYFPFFRCFAGDQKLVMLHVICDATAGLAFVAISSSLGVLVYRAYPHLPFQWMVISFGIFILGCGANRFMEVLTMWHPVYWVEGDVKLITAVASVFTAVALPSLIPRVLLLVETARASEDRRQRLEAANKDLAELRRREAEAAASKLHEKEQKLVLALEASGIGMWSWDLRSNAGEADAQVHRHLGVGLNEPLSAGFLGRTVHPDDQARIASLFQRTMRTAEDYEADFRVVWPNQKIRWVSARGRVFRDTEGRPRQILGVTLDISDRKSAEQSIKENESRFRQLADTMPQMVWTATPDGRAEYYNRARKKCIIFSGWDSGCPTRRHKLFAKRKKFYDAKATIGIPDYHRRALFLEACPHPPRQPAGMVVSPNAPGGRTRPSPVIREPRLVLALHTDDNPTQVNWSEGLAGTRRRRDFTKSALPAAARVENLSPKTGFYPTVRAV